MSLPKTLFLYPLNSPQSLFPINPALARLSGSMANTKPKAAKNKVPAFAEEAFHATGKTSRHLTEPRCQPNAPFKPKAWQTGPRCRVSLALLHPDIQGPAGESETHSTWNTGSGTRDTVPVGRPQTAPGIDAANTPAPRQRSLEHVGQLRFHPTPAQLLTPPARNRQCDCKALMPATRWPSLTCLSLIYREATAKPSIS
ncbi:hypothetical protein MDA_GLEAN10013658 [Myotis davidii]|uniref:Uncharacterized protein n=1 Tax=Myotis davidii TaxID=225400 RepID=L5MBS1_MYODS|nr:hypothetical protein MDA_GLEAN10013658 [Myotis davidii]